MPSAGPPLADSVIKRKSVRHASSGAHGKVAETETRLSEPGSPGDLTNDNRTMGTASILQIVKSLPSGGYPSGPCHSKQSCSVASCQRPVLGISMGWSSAATPATIQPLRRRLLG